MFRAVHRYVLFIKNNKRGGRNRLAKEQKVAKSDKILRVQ